MCGDGFVMWFVLHLMVYCVAATAKGDDDLLDDWLNDLNSITSSNSQQVSDCSCVCVCVCVGVCVCRCVCTL